MFRGLLGCQLRLDLIQSWALGASALPVTPWDRPVCIAVGMALKLKMGGSKEALGIFYAIELS